MGFSSTVYVSSRSGPPVRRGNGFIEVEVSAWVADVGERLWLRAFGRKVRKDGSTGFQRSSVDLTREQVPGDVWSDLLDGLRADENNQREALGQASATLAALCTGGAS